VQTKALSSEAHIDTKNLRTGFVFFGVDESLGVQWHLFPKQSKEITTHSQLKNAAKKANPRKNCSHVQVED
jgi:hypothetical protein